ncbi:MAG TPA: metalloenzyme [Thermoanaerobaculia bacterium]|nr:metalloenzyme [Thermoanaerobaculia bacterium]
MARFLLLFVDGVGLGPATAGNPLVRPGLPALHGSLGGPLTIERAGHVGEGAALAALDAALGVEGLPQSATGQTALFTGINAPELLGRHVAAFPGPRLAALLAEHSLLRAAASRGHRVTFANPYSRRNFDEVEGGRRRHSATTLAVLAAGIPLRDLDDLAAGRACAWDVTRERFRAWAPEVEPVAARSAGEHLAAVAAENDLTLWETFMTDLAGHRRLGWTPEQALERLDGLLAGLLALRPADLTVLLVSDHGNLEEPAHRSHTRNPVPLVAIGPEARSFGDLDRLDRLAPRLLSRLGAPG